MIVTLRNDFHGTTARIRVNVTVKVLSEAVVRRVRRALCGIDGCTCGGALGQRPVAHQSHRIEISELPNGRVMVHALPR